MTDALHREACVNFEAVLASARDAFRAGDIAGAQRKLKAAEAVAERVKSRRARAA